MQASKNQQKQLVILKNRSDFLKMNKNAKRWVSHGLALQCLDNDLDEYRVGYTATKRTSPKAVDRNRIKRRLRAIAADILPLHAKPSCDYVLIGRKGTLTRSYDELKNDLLWCLKKLDFLKERP